MARGSALVLKGDGLPRLPLTVSALAPLVRKQHRDVLPKLISFGHVSAVKVCSDCVPSSLFSPSQAFPGHRAGAFRRRFGEPPANSRVSFPHRKGRIDVW